MGLFLNLRPFYIRNVSLKDIKMCCCKLHLHGRWSVIVIIRIAAKLEIQLPFTDYSSFFSLLYADCGDIIETYIPWECTSNKKEVCDDIMRNFFTIMNLPTVDEKTTIAFTRFEKQVQYDSDGQMIMNKENKPVEKLVAVKEQVNAKFLVEFTRNLLPDIIHHRNLLKLYRNIKGTFLDIMQCVYMDVDFSENLAIGVKQEPQSLHWTKHQVTVHSGIVKYSQEKTYHSYFSNSRVHDQPFAHQALQEMISWTDIRDGTHIIIESDNCTGQYKSIQHFYHLQLLCNELNRLIIRLYGIAGHRKGEVNHVGGVAKVAVRAEIAAGEVFDKSDEIVFVSSEQVPGERNPLLPHCRNQGDSPEGGVGC